MSLSGGVDSMVILTLLKRLYPHRPIAAVHIDYGNRETTATEEAFVRTWARLIGVPYYVRRIREIFLAPAKKLNLRAVYESYTRDVRYNTYRYVHERVIAGGAGGAGGAGVPAVVLGHHEDDAFENVLTNMIYCEKFECLRGMRDIGRCDGIDFHRPLLRVSKQDVYKTAWALGIPYLEDSTRPECKRGQIRDVVRPTLEQWEPLVVERMLEVADVMAELASSFEREVQLAAKQTRSGADGSLTWDATKMGMGDALLSSRFWRRYFFVVARVVPSRRCLENMVALLRRMMKNRAGEGCRRKRTSTMFVVNKRLRMRVSRRTDGDGDAMEFYMTFVEGDA